MKLVKLFGRVGTKSWVQLARLCLFNPIFVWPTFLATKACMRISTRQFGSEHYQNGPANAFRHALWNFLIAKKCHRYSKNMEKVLAWTKGITDWHENAFKNDPLNRAMDFHNNAVGRRVFEQHAHYTDDEMITAFLRMTSVSLKINRVEDIGVVKGLVHL